ncbi:DNA photolyase, FAD-binding/Cryptochrome [Multifurca ochricompacta]|uniref:DNA photolyase, FAD-binding/Cryptochrome n=1 Tax=Multifurca ochricompacta TaxID=376703 RepID=A0AAD4MCV2_9AGAM|nr:DNA photolyase, FAD-binding/Cryptochrome [Multifurca ochricompacta]
MTKRTLSVSPTPCPSKKQKTLIESHFNIGRVSSPQAAAAVDADPPLGKLLSALENISTNSIKIGDAIAYWMRMQDMRICDNRALARASAKALEDHIPLVVFFVLSPQDYVAHDRSPRRVDFTLRNLAILKDSLAKLNIPLHVSTHTPRRTLPSYVISLLQSFNATRVFANIEYEVDELRRDIAICTLANDNGIHPTFVHDKLIVEPGLLSTKQGKPYTVYSPFQRQWLSTLNQNTDKYLAEAASPFANSPSVKNHPVISKLFASETPSHVENFRCPDKDIMAVVWPAGTDAARKMLHRFLFTKSRDTHLGLADPLEEGAVISEKQSRAMTYKDHRDRADRDTTSRLSRECVRAVVGLLGVKKVQASRDSGVEMWIQEIAWRDFIHTFLLLSPRLDGSSIQEKYADVQTGHTGVPIVDAAIRQAIPWVRWMHNRTRMIAAMYLTKDLLIDWRLGERHFMQQFIDGDLASNNGGWQWSATDPNGDYIRTFVPELSNVFGPDIHNPPAKPLIDHKEARDRALRRYKNPGSR